MEAARKVKTGKLTSPVYLNDDPTLQRRDDFRAARDMKARNEISNAWIWDGQILIKSLNGTKSRFHPKMIQSCFIDGICQGQG